MPPSILENGMSLFFSPGMPSQGWYDSLKLHLECEA